MRVLSSHEEHIVRVRPKQKEREVIARGQGMLYEVHEAGKAGAPMRVLRSYQELIVRVRPTQRERERSRREVKVFYTRFKRLEGPELP